MSKQYRKIPIHAFLMFLHLFCFSRISTSSENVAAVGPSKLRGNLLNLSGIACHLLDPLLNFTFRSLFPSPQAILPDDFTSVWAEVQLFKRFSFCQVQSGNAGLRKVKLSKVWQEWNQRAVLPTANGISAQVGEKDNELEEKSFLSFTQTETTWQR